MIPWNPDATAQDHLAAARDGLRLIEAFGEMLTRRQLDLLTLMRDREDADPGCDEAELVREGGDAYLDDTRIASRTVDVLLRACAIRAEQDSHVAFERYRINETGRELLTRAGR